jgi:hypothetical protein
MNFTRKRGVRLFSQRKRVALDIINSEPRRGCTTKLYECLSLGRLSSPIMQRHEINGHDVGPRF